MITESARYQGAVLAHIVDNWDGPIAIRRAFGEAAGFYILNERLPIFIKYSTKRYSPWTFTFQREHQMRQQALFDKLGECLMVFGCGRDGIAAISHQDFRKVLDNYFEEQESVSLRRRHAEMYKIRGRDGELERKIGRNSLIDLLSSLKESGQFDP
ncbi:MAG: hypothetical protein AAGA22_00100 [Pseudomonadota bacterium]